MASLAEEDNNSVYCQYNGEYDIKLVLRDHLSIDAQTKDLTKNLFCGAVAERLRHRSRKDFRVRALLGHQC